MGSVVSKLTKAGSITPPSWMEHNVHYETIMGSIAYGVSNDDSDFDIYGFCIPPKNDIFPHLNGYILNFGTQYKPFEQYQKHHIMDPNGLTANNGDIRQYDLTIYSITKYFDLIMGCNPNMIDSIFTPQRCVLHATKIAQMVRENRKIFLNKSAWHTFKGYAFSQMKKIKDKTNSSNPKRAATIEEFGYDIKFAYHVVRLLNEVEQILLEHDLDLERNREQLKSIRRGEWTLEQIETYFESKERSLEDLYTKSDLRLKPDEDAVRQLLIDCLEEHYDNISDAVKITGHAERALLDIQAILDKMK